MKKSPQHFETLVVGCIDSYESEKSGSLQHFHEIYKICIYSHLSDRKKFSNFSSRILLFTQYSHSSGTINKILQFSSRFFLNLDQF